MNMDWARALDAAVKVEEVLEIAEEFLATRSDIYGTGVPAGLRAARTDGFQILAKFELPPESEHKLPVVSTRPGG